MFGMNDGSPLQLPNELLLFITKSLDDTNCLSLALSGAFQGFTSFFASKWEADAIIMSYKNYFLSHPRLWNTFVTQHKCYPSTITTFKANDCYWMPADMLVEAIVKMENLTELSMKDTKMTFSHLGQVLGNCQKILKLELSYRKKKWEDIKNDLTDEKLVCITQGFEKLTSLKIATCFQDARDYMNDPWILIIRLLSWCRDCVELAVEITYTGETFKTNYSKNRSSQKMMQFLGDDGTEVYRMVDNLLDKMDWVVNLKTLVLVKFGLFSNFDAGNDTLLVRSLALNQLLSWIFSSRRKPVSLRNLWIQRFKTSIAPINIWKTTLPMTSYFVEDNSIYLGEADAMDIDDQSWFSKHIDITPDERFSHLEHLAQLKINHEPIGDAAASDYLPNLKFARATCEDTDYGRQMLEEFLLSHSNLEHLQLELTINFPVYVPSKANLKLPKLRSLGYEDNYLNQEIVEAIVKICPNIEWLHLNKTVSAIFYDGDFLSAINFPNLNSLHIYEILFPLGDAASLLTIIKNCPKLRSFHINGTFDPSTFFDRFQLFLSSATKLRDLRLGLNLNSNGGGSPILRLLESLLLSSKELERLFVFDNDHDDQDDPWNHPPEMANDVVHFASEMKRLVGFCLVFSRFDPSLIQEVCSRIENQVVQVRPSLWFKMDRYRPELTDDPDIPFIHYHEMIDPIYYFPPPAF